MAHVPPQAVKTDLSRLYVKNRANYSDKDYKLIFEQTGLGKSAVSSLYSTRELALYQDRLYAKADVRRYFNSLFFFEEYVENPQAELIPLEDGDILLTSSSQVFTWRNGHAAIVVNAEEGKILEAIVIGKPSVCSDTDKWRYYPNFKVLRLKNASKSNRAAIAETAEKYLDNLPYNLLSGIYPRKYCEADKARSTQCAHLVWLAYAVNGYDIDSDGGLIVTPDDISKSSLFEIVQTYG